MGLFCKVGKTLDSYSENYFSGTDQERLDDFQDMLDDDNVNAILCARGGYGLSRIIDQVDFSTLKRSQNGSLALVISLFYIPIFIPIIK